MNTNHSPLPWHLGMKPGPIVYGPSGEQVASLHVAMVPVEENKANAQYIVQACNAFPALVDALEAIASMRPPLMTKEQEKAFEYHPSTCDAYRVDMAKVLLNAITEARAALALARGGKGGE